MTWIYLYDRKASPEVFGADVAAPELSRPARLVDHRLSFAVPAADGGVAVATVTAAEGGQVLGAAYRVDDETRDALAALYPHHELRAATARLSNGDTLEVQVPVLAGDAEAARPDEGTLGEIREGLSFYHPMTRIDRYLKAAVGLEKLYAGPMVQREAEADYKFEYNSDFRRLFPWKGVTRPPWGSAIGVVAPGEATIPHNHDEEETALIVGGEGELTIEGNTTSIRRGDVIYFPPFQTHTLLNTSETENLEILFTWWGGVAEEEREQVRMHA